MEEDVITLKEYRKGYLNWRAEQQDLNETLAELDSELTSIDSVVERFNKMYNYIKEKINSFDRYAAGRTVVFIESVFEKIYLTRDYEFEKIEFKFDFLIKSEVWPPNFFL